MSESTRWEMDCTMEPSDNGQWVRAGDYESLEAENRDLQDQLNQYRNGYQGSCMACEPVALKNQALEAENRALREAIEADPLICTPDQWTQKEWERVDASYDDPARSFEDTIAVILDIAQHGGNA